MVEHNHGSPYPVEIVGKKLTTSVLGDAETEVVNHRYCKYWAREFSGSGRTRPIAPAKRRFGKISDLNMSGTPNTQAVNSENISEEGGYALTPSSVASIGSVILSIGDRCGT